MSFILGVCGLVCRHICVYLHALRRSMCRPRAGASACRAQTHLPALRRCVCMAGAGAAACRVWAHSRVMRQCICMTFTDASAMPRAGASACGALAYVHACLRQRQALFATVRQLPRLPVRLLGEHEDQRRDGVCMHVSAPSIPERLKHF